MTIYIFGNPLVPQDSLPVKLLPELKKEFPDIEFVIRDPTENWTGDEKEVIIIDTIVGIDKVTLFNSLDSFQQTGSRISLHDYDVFFDLALLLKLEKIKKITILGVPPTIGSKEALHQLILHIANLTLSI